LAGKIFVKTDKTSHFKVLDGRSEDLSCIDPDYIHVFTDGGGNCGPASIGIIVIDKGIVQMTHGEFLGDNLTNNIAELTAILRGLQLVKSKKIPVKLYADSNYSLQSIAGVYNGRKNRELIDSITEYVKAYPVEVVFVKVKGHAKILYNEMADSIASNMLKLQKETQK
jgi:ribonuclease HI